MSRKPLTWTAVGVTVAAGAFAAVTLADATPTGRYRVAVAAVGDVTQTVTTSGTVDHVNRADLTFGTAGTLATLTVAVGDKVSAGQQLATVDTAALQAAVDTAAADVTAADVTAEEESQEQAEEPVPDEVGAAQQAATAALAAAQAAMARQAAACTDPPPPACSAALTETAQAQEAVRAAQNTLQAKLSEQSRQPARGPAHGGEASVAEAEAKLVEAEQALAGATLTAPIAGTVASVDAAVGDRVTTSDPALVVIGEGAAVVTATVPVEQVATLAVGQEATVTPAGASTSVPGTVTKVGTLPDSSDETVAYPVTITVADPPASMAPGSSATAAITVATAKDVLTVPTSAVNRGMVQVLTGEEPTRTPVTVGAVGPVRTEIKEGLSAGDEVVLADLDAPLPTGDEQQTPGGFRMGPGGGGGPGVTKMIEGGR